MLIETPRLRLRPWTDADRAPFAALHSDPDVMRDQGGPIDRAKSDEKLDWYGEAFEQFGFCSWAVESHAGEFLGYSGVMPAETPHPLGEHFEVVWRMSRSAWGHGYAPEAARAALHDVFRRARLPIVFAYTAPDNLRSQAVMNKLGLRRDPARDFTHDYENFPAWHGLVWVAEPPTTE
jgi:RimJ/RimL family protein N-acetyltransferase